jgi:hypothetical protein
MLLASLLKTPLFALCNMSLLLGTSHRVSRRFVLFCYDLELTHHYGFSFALAHLQVRHFLDHAPMQPSRLFHHSCDILSKCRSYSSGSTASNTLMSLCPTIAILILAKTHHNSCCMFCTSPSSALITLAIPACLLVPLFGSQQSHSHHLLVTPCPTPISLFGCTPLPHLRRPTPSASGPPVSDSSQSGSQQSS